MTFKPFTDVKQIRHLAEIRYKHVSIIVDGPRPPFFTGLLDLELMPDAVVILSEHGWCIDSSMLPGKARQRGFTRGFRIERGRTLGRQMLCFDAWGVEVVSIAAPSVTLPCGYEMEEG